MTGSGRRAVVGILVSLALAAGIRVARSQPRVTTGAWPGVAPGAGLAVAINLFVVVPAFVTQAVTGIFLWMAYSPSSQTAWESVYYIQHEMWGGWLVRGVHHFMAQAMVVVLALHLLQVVVDGAYRAPREVNY